jgi:type II secretory ATPase GspE/PulE/Tfp pilus assembly ATPase PilB-like protein
VEHLSDEKEEPPLEREIEGLQHLAARASAMELVGALIESATKTRATDIHFDPQEEKLRVRYRIDGALYDIIELPRRVEPAVLSRLKILSNMDITNTRTPQDGHFMIRFGDHDYDLRVATISTYFGEKIVLRFLGSTNILKNLKDLGMDPADKLAIDRFIKRKGGMLLVTGPMGSGKTTTLYGVLNSLNVLAENILPLRSHRISGMGEPGAGEQILGTDLRAFSAGRVTDGYRHAHGG